MENAQPPAATVDDRHQAEARQAFAEAAALPWRQAFVEPGTADWQDRWHLDGEKATIRPRDGGFDFAAGPEAGNDAHMAVLWTRQSFAGDVRISYDYTRLDDAEHYVTILYIQATGTGLGPYKKDILAWADRRTVPAMSTYFQHMNLLHVSYAAMATPAMLARGADDRMYIRARRYPIPAGGRFEDIVLPPDHYDQDLWQTGVRHHVDVIKRGPCLLMKVTPEGGETRTMRWDATGWPPLTEGRIGLRHMASRSARYEDFTVRTLGEDAPPVAQSWTKMRSVEDVVAAYPERMTDLLDALDLTRPGLERVAEARARGEVAGACQALLAYYRACDSGAWLRDPGAEAGPDLIEKADGYLADIYLGHDGPGRMLRTANGHLAWGYTGPRTDQGFRSRVNRHSHLSVLMRAYLATGEAKYLDRLDRDLRDWITAADGRITPWATGTLEPSLRLPHWTAVFYGLQDEDGFHPATRLLLLAGIAPQADYLQESLRPHHNFATMQMSGLGIAGLAFPEFKRAAHWVRFATRQMREEIDAQVYPDGVQKELTSNYHLVALGNFQKLADAIHAAGQDVPPDYERMLARMSGYIADSVSPDGVMPVNNDSGARDYTRRLLKAADRYDRPDWRYIATRGAEGSRPADPPSRFYAWPGHLISRSGWDADAQWSFFDVGPYGASHQHNDKLHLSVRAGERHLLVDCGRFAYSGPLAERFRLPYAFHSRGHNVILIDGYGQQAYAPEADAPHVFARVAEDFDFALGTFDAGYDPTPTGATQAWNGLDAHERLSALDAVHSRAVVYLRGRGWVVIDRVQAPGTHTLQPLWHFHPDCTVAVDGQALRTTDADQPNLHLQPVGEVDWSVAIVAGRESPTPQGWYSETYGKAEPAPCGVYETTVEDAATVGWVITTGRGAPVPPAVRWLEAPAGAARLRVRWPEGPAQTITVVMDEAALPLDLHDGGSLAARLLIEEDGEEPRIACGWLRDTAGRTLVEDPLPRDAALADLVNGLAIRAAPEDGEGSVFRLPLRNLRFQAPLRIRVAEAADNAPAWRAGNLPAAITLAPGEKATLALPLKETPGRARYPLPQLEVALALPGPAAADEPLRHTRVLDVPLIGSRPRLRIGPAPAAPRLDGTHTEPAWQRPADIPLLGRMDLGRTVAPATAAWATFDETHLYVAFRCQEPRLEALRLAAAERDANVFKDDSVEVFLAPEGDDAGRDYWQVVLNAAGKVFDSRGLDNDATLTGLQTAVETGEDAWTAEIAIPWAGAGLDGPPPQAGLLLGRNRYAGGETEIFQFPVSPKGNHQPDHYARLVPQP